MVWGIGMEDVNPGSIRSKNGRVSIWRVPNFLLEPRGNFFGEPDELIGRLNKVRSVAGAVIVIGMIVVYAGIAHLGYTGGKGGALFVGTQNTPEGHWLLGLIVSMAIALLVVPLTSLALVLYTKSSARKATLYQLRRPFIEGCPKYQQTSRLQPTTEGAVTITVLSLMTIYRLRKQPAWPFRNGPQPPQPKASREVPDHP